MMSLEIGRAADYFGRALELVPPDHEDRERILARAAVTAARSGRFEEAEREYEEAIALATAAGANRQAGDAMVGLAAVLWHRGDTARHREVLTSGIGLLEGAGPSPELAKAYAEEAITCATSGLLDRAVTWSNKALEMASRLELSQLRMQALAFRGGARCELGDLGGLDDLREALVLTADVGTARETAQVQAILGGVLWVTDGPPAAVQAFEAGIETAERRGITDMSMGIRSQLLGPLFDLGEWDRLVDAADQVVSWFRAHGGGYFEVVAQTLKARVEMYRGQLPASHPSEHVSAARAIADVQVLIPGLAVGALNAWLRGDTDDGTALIEELRELTDNRSGWYLVPFAPDLVRMCVTHGRTDLARGLEPSVHGSARRNELTATTVEALLDEAEGAFDEAARRFAGAASGWREYGSIPEHGFALLGEGRCLVQLGRSEASERLQAAGSIFKSLGAGPPLVELEPWLTRAAMVGSTAQP
jgi:tetratricopeptide (TPR) repeat protein